MKDTVFLRGEWRNLLMVNYAIDPEILEPYLPPGTELDTYNGIHYVSLVGFLFKDTRVKGIIVPYHRTFEEVNLRFYVRHYENGKWKRGVVFIKEIVPRKLIAMVANKIFGEKYAATDMGHQWLKLTTTTMSVEYMWKERNEWNWIVAKAESSSHFPKPDSETSFICEHYSGFTKSKKDQSFEYIVDHPTWRTHEVLQYDINCDFEKVYGKDFAFLSGQKPLSVFLAEGSEITVSHKKPLSWRIKEI